MTFETEQLIIFAAILGGSFILGLGFTVRAVYLVIKSESNRSKVDWVLAATFGAAATIMAFFQLYRIINRF
jgi:hypothetical protein